MAPVIDLDHEGMHSETISHGILFICIAIGLLLFIFALFLCCYEIVSMRMCMRWKKKKRTLPPPLALQHQLPAIVTQTPDNSPMVNQEATQELKASPEIGTTTGDVPKSVQLKAKDIGLCIYTIPEDVEIGLSSVGIQESGLGQDSIKSEGPPSDRGKANDRAL